MGRKFKALGTIAVVGGLAAAAFLAYKNRPKKQLNVTELESIVLERFPGGEITSIVDTGEEGFFLVRVTSGGEEHEVVASVNGDITVLK